MIGKPLVSIIVPIYNVVRFVPACVESLVKQTYRNIEILLVNDGSPDNSLEICKSFAKKDPRIVVIDQKNSGVSEARNTGIAACKGEWICFVDGDDCLEADAIERMLGCVDEETEILITGYYVDSVSKCWRESFFDLPDCDFDESERIELIKNCFLRTSFGSKISITMVGVPWAKLFKASAIKNKSIRFDVNLKKMQDALFCSEMFKSCSKIRYRNLPTYHYRYNNTSVTHKGNAAYREIADAVLNAFLNFIKRYHYEEELLPVYYARKFMFACETVKFVCILDKTGMTLFQKSNVINKLMAEFNPKDHERKMLPYLTKPYKIAYVFNRLNAYLLMYLAMSFFYELKMKKLER